MFKEDIYLPERTAIKMPTDGIIKTHYPLTMNITWFNFYQQRIGTSYHNYFKERYAPFIEKIINLKPKNIIEEGVGIASVSRCLRDEGIQLNGFDINPFMIKLAKDNCGQGYWYEDDILNPAYNLEYINRALAITHGVLEHFTNEEIRRIFRRYRKNKTPSIHYVPLDKYITPSFGDERLLPYTYWLDLIEPDEYKVFNDGHDLWFYKK